MTQSLLTATAVAGQSLVVRRLRKASLSLLLAGVTTVPAWAQFGYSAALTQAVTGSYTALGATATAITVANNDDANSAPQPIGFTFNFNGQNFTEFILNTNGFIKLGNVDPSSAALFYADPVAAANGVFASSNPSDDNIIAPFALDLQPAASGTPTFRFTTTGTAPNQVCTIEWSGLRDKITPPDPQLGSIRFQVKLYETSGMVEFVYGNWTANASATATYRAAEVGVKGSGTDAVIVRKASGTPFGDAANLLIQDGIYDETQDAGANVRFNYRSSVMPTSGVTYRFSSDAACPRVTGLAASNVTGNSATITFTPPTGAQGYTLKYGPAGFDPMTAGTAVTTTTTSVNLTGLTAATGYQVYVRTDCSATLASPYAGPILFATQCVVGGPVTAYPFTMNFDNVIRMFDIPCGTEVEDSNLDNNTWGAINQDSLPATLPLTARSAPNFMAYIYNAQDTTVEADDWFFLPAMQMAAGGQPYQLSFWQRVASGNFPEGLEVMYGTQPNSASMTTTIYSGANLTNTTFTQRTATPIQPPTSGVYYIGFHAISTPNQFILMLDDVRVTGPNPTTGLAADELTRAVAVYPNPTAGKVTLSLSKTGARNISVRVLDNLGRVVYTGSATDNATEQLDLNHLANGLYTLQVQLDGQQVTRQLNVQK